MKHQKLNDRARVWTVSIGCDGQLRAELDERVLATIDPMAHALVIAATRDDGAPDPA